MNNRVKHFSLHALVMAFVAIAISSTFSCKEEHEHMAPAVNEKDSVAMMISYGVNTMISDSGVIKYGIVAERWDVNDKLSRPRWFFLKGIFLKQFDEKFHVESYIQSDTAYYYNVEKLWELRGRVRIHTKSGLDFSSEELFWDENRHELYSFMYSHLKTPERELQGAYFRSDERMTRYEVTNTKGAFERKDIDSSSKEDENGKEKNDSVQQYQRPPASPQKRNPNTSIPLMH